MNESDKATNYATYGIKRLLHAGSIAGACMVACTSNQPTISDFQHPPHALTSAETTFPLPSPSSPSPPASSAPGPSSAAAPTIYQACPPEMAEVGKSCVDRWEGHLVVVAPNGEAVVHSPFERPDPKTRYEARSAASTVPQAYISRIEAQSACEAAGKRLCSLREWYRACRGPQGFMYPYGAQMVRNACNTSKPHLLTRLYGNNPRAWKYDDHFNDPQLNQEPGFLAKTGEYERCISAYGVADMVGNLHEWISDTVDASLEDKIPLRDDIRSKIPKNTGHGIFMGGFFSTTSEHGRGCSFITIGHEPKYHDYSTGMRCCKNTSPPTAPATQAQTTL